MPLAVFSWLMTTLVISTRSLWRAVAPELRHLPHGPDVVEQQAPAEDPCGRLCEQRSLVAWSARVGAL
jgi:hypothetical protein